MSPTAYRSRTTSAQRQRLLAEFDRSFSRFGNRPNLMTSATRNSCFARPHLL